MHTDFQELERALATFERDLETALHHCHHHGGTSTPASIRLTVQ